jgi:hypothetical protein
LEKGQKDSAANSTNRRSAKAFVRFAPVQLSVMDDINSAKAAAFARKPDIWKRGKHELETIRSPQNVGSQFGGVGTSPH